MERTMSTVVEVEADTWTDALRAADEEGVPSHEEGDIAQEWTAVMATNEQGQTWERNQ